MKKEWVLIIKYLIVAILSFLIDILLFSIFNYILDIKIKIILATIIARIISSFINYLLNNYLVFESKELSLSSKMFFCESSISIASILLVFKLFIT